jgi:hypothetical protein
MHENATKVNTSQIFSSFNNIVFFQLFWFPLYNPKKKNQQIASLFPHEWNNVEAPFGYIIISTLFFFNFQPLHSQPNALKCSSISCTQNIYITKRRATTPKMGERKKNEKAESKNSNENKHKLLK